MLTTLELPPLDPDSLQHSERVAAAITAAIRSAGGWLSFADFMALALYAPGLGYYVAGARKFGADGDFVTAPEVSPLFARCLATQLAEVLTTLRGGDILEFGAGSGVLCVDLLTALAACDRLPDRYFIVEVSGDLRERQQRLLRERLPQLAARVSWLDALPAADWRGVILANEVLDAMPVQRFRITAGGCEELGVAVGPEGFVFAARPAPPELFARILEIESSLAAALPAGYVSEVNVRMPAWLSSAAEHLQRGVVLLSDYGCTRADYFAPERDGGTLACFFRQRVHGNAFLNPGVQDITAWVDFTAVAEAAIACKLDVAGYATQAHFLLSLGIERELERSREQLDDRQWAALAASANMLLLPGEMGERFKVMALTRDYEAPLAGYSFRDLTETL